MNDSAGCTSGPPSSDSTSPSSSSTGSASSACPAATPTTCPPTDSPSTTPSPPSALSCSAPPCCRSCGTSSGPCGTAKSPPPTTPGGTATPWNGPPAAHHPGTTSSRCPGSAPNDPPSNCTTPKCRNGCTTKPAPAGPHPPWPRRKPAATCGSERTSRIRPRTHTGRDIAPTHTPGKQQRTTPPMQDFDAVIIGAGPNGLAAGNVLAEAGWHVLVLEGQDRIGGAVASDEAVHDGFIHDTFSSFYPLAAASPVLTAMHLDRFGLTWSHAPAVVGSPDPGGGWALIQHDPRDTAEGLEQLHPGDGDAWERMYRDWTHIGDCLVDALLSPFPPVRAGLRAATKLRQVGGLSFIRMLLEPSRTLTSTRLRGSAAQLLIAGNAAHADIPPDAAGSGLFGWLLAMLAQDVGFPVAQGGAGHLAAALAARLEFRGGDIRCNAEVTRMSPPRNSSRAAR